MPHIVLQTKLYIPPHRPTFIKRERLFDILDDGLYQGSGLVLISAPAGYGKSILVAEWLRSLIRRDNGRTRVFWLSLDENDNVPTRFLTYLAAALKCDDNGAGFNLQGMLGSPQLPPIDLLMTGLINSINNWADPQPGNESSVTDRYTVLVLDDYQKIKHPLIQECTQFLLEHRPHRLQLVLITREDPPLTLSRIRAQGELTELRALDLRFTVDETAQFLNQVMGLNLRQEWVESLASRTEGWIAGLQLAAMSLRERADIAAFLVDFSGSHRYLIDYLMDEVLAIQSEKRRDFLYKTSVLDRFNASLCDAVTGKNDSKEELAEIEQANLFLIPLDDRREWYRYHQLFADCLRTGVSTDLQINLKKKAAVWFEEHGFVADAVEYSLATGDYELAADTIERVLNTPRSWSSGKISMLEGWLAVLPESCVTSRPDLQIRASRALFLAGKLNQSALMLEQAEGILYCRASLREDVKSSLAQIGIYKGAILAMKGHISLAKSLIQQALPDLTDDLLLQARACDTIGLICEQAGDLAEATDAYLTTSNKALSAGVTYLAINARCEAAMVQISQARLTGAEKTCSEALGFANKRIPPTGLAWAVMGEIARERNELTLAERYLMDGMELSQQGGITDDLRHELIYLVRLRLSQKNYKGTLSALQQAELVLRSYHIPRLSALSSAIRAGVSLELGELAEASRWAKDFVCSRSKESVEYLEEFEELMLARIWLSEKNYLDAQQLLQKIISVAEANSRKGTLIKALLLNALVSWHSGNKADARSSLECSITLAEPEGYIRTFVDEGEVVYFLLSDLIQHSSNFTIRRYCEKLLPAFDYNPLAVKKLDAKLSPSNIESLTEQELKILQMIEKGLSNQEIASKLVISLGTAKWHVHNIYEKLGVNSRTKAIARAKEFKLIK